VVDASPLERMITLCNAGVMAMDGRSALNLLRRIGNGNAKGEYYLTDAVEIARTLELGASVVETTEDEVRGINTKSQLAEAEAAMQRKLRDAAMAEGVTLVAPETIYLAADTKFGKDVTVEPFVVFGPGVTVGDGAVIRSFSHIAEASIGNNAIVGPYARLPPDAMPG
jgi:bifunctional UDP-N-acetylglucosamine pyrophosphorylase/glucosamine-1-phosphate N-acetyltransferase